MSEEMSENVVFVKKEEEERKEKEQEEKEKEEKEKREQREKEEKEKEKQKQKEKEKDANFKALLLASGLKFGSVFCLMQATPSFVMKAYPGNGTKALSVLSQAAASAALLEVFINPICGQISDRYGRFGMLAIPPFLSTFFRGATVAKPTLTLVLVGRVIMGALGSAYLTTANAAIGDMFRSQGAEKIANSTALLYASVGVSAVIGSILGGRLTEKDIRYPYILSTVCTIISFVVLMTKFRETVPKEEQRAARKKEMSIASSNPLSFLSMFTSGSYMAKLSCLTALQAFPAWMGDVVNVHATEVRGWDAKERSLFQASQGLLDIVASVASRRILRSVGVENLTKFANFGSILAHVGFGGANVGWKAYSSLLLNSFALQRNNVIASLLMVEGTKGGRGTGELMAMNANLVAVVKILSPLIFGHLYSVGKSKNIYGLHFYGAAVLLCLFQGLILSVKKEDWNSVSKAKKN